MSDVTRRTFINQSCKAVAATIAAPEWPAAQSLTAPAKKIYTDPIGLITQRDDDGGDTAQREGMYWLAVWVRREILRDPWSESRSLSYEQVMRLLEVDESGEFRRHPRRWNDPKDFTRDQTVPLVAAMGVHDDKSRLERFYRELRRRNWFAQNGKDPMIDPVHRNLVRRARDEEPSRLTDAPSLMAAAVSRVVAAKTSLDNVGDDLNMVVIFSLAAVRKGNNEADRARLFYAKNRPDNYGMFLGSYREKYGTDWSGATSKEEMSRRMDAGIMSGWKPDCPRVLGALRWYFRAETKGSPGMADLYEPIVRRWFE